jgi:hypothetical protein
MLFFSLQLQHPSVVLPLISFSLPLLMLLVFVSLLHPFSFVMHHVGILLPFISFSFSHKPDYLMHLPLYFSHLSWNSSCVLVSSFLCLLVSFEILLQLLLSFGGSLMIFFSLLVPWPSIFLDLSPKAIETIPKFFSFFLLLPLGTFL